MEIMSADIKNIKVAKVVKETKDAVSIYFNQEDFSYEYESGQYLTLVANINGEEVRRPYSMCTAYGIDQKPGVTIKRVNGGKMSNFLNDQVKEGTEIGVMPTIGNFKYIPSSENRDILLIGGGSGVTPLMSILKKALNSEEQSKVINKATSVFTSKLVESDINFDGEVDCPDPTDEDNYTTEMDRLHNGSESDKLKYRACLEKEIRSDLSKGI